MTATAPSEQARPFVGLTLVELARDCLRARGLSTMGSPATILERAVGGGGMMSTSDFPAILGDAVSRTMRQAYAEAPSGLRRVARQTTARDFRMKHRIQLSAAPTLEKVNEAGEFHSDAIVDQKESYKIDTYGRILGLTRQAIINDDLGAFSDLTRRMGQSAAAFENQFLVDILEANAHMDDGENVFSAAHGNLAGGTGAAPSDTTLASARLAMRSQTGLAGELIDVTPRYVIVPSALETATEKVLTAIQAVQVTDVNPWSYLSLIVEPRLADPKKWFVVADPAIVDGLEYAYLEGEPGPSTFSEIGFDTDGVRYKIRLDFGAAFVEPRGWFCNPGQ